jgi:peroxiredoxin
MRQAAAVFATLTFVGLIGSTASAQEPAGLKQRLALIFQAHQAARDRYHEGLKGKTTAEATKPAIDEYHEAVSRNTDAVLDLVRAHPKDPAVVEGLRFVIDTARAGPGDQAYLAMEILLRDHVLDPAIGDVCARMFYFSDAPIAETLIRTVIEKNPSRDVRGSATHTLAFYLKLQASRVRRVRENPALIEESVAGRTRNAEWRSIKNIDPTLLDREVEGLLERVIGEFADLKINDDPRPLGVIAQGELFAIRNLAVGKVAPEIRGQDHLGKAFSLNDYRGKVVVLTFSGNWCGPCVAMYPDERELVSKLKHRPFAMLSVNTDETVETLRKSIESGDVTWRCWWESGTSGPITTEWGISGFPSIFVLDPSGVIRFKDLRGEDLKRAVMQLLDEPGRPNPPSSVQ